MGKIKSKLIRRTGNSFLKRGVEFGPDFEENKKILGANMPSKKIRNQIAGYLSKVKKTEKQNKQENF